MITGPSGLEVSFQKLLPLRGLPVCYPRPLSRTLCTVLSITSTTPTSVCSACFSILYFIYLFLWLQLGSGRWEKCLKAGQHQMRLSQHGGMWGQTGASVWSGSLEGKGPSLAVWLSRLGPMWPLTVSVTLGKLNDLPEPRFPHLWKVGYKYHMGLKSKLYAIYRVFGMEYFSIVYSVLLGKSDTPCYLLKWKGAGSGHHTGKEELQKIRHTIV